MAGENKVRERAAGSEGQPAGRPRGSDKRGDSTPWFPRSVLFMPLP